ncbi:AAA family ATPase [Ruminococcus sp.]|uniref:AAA family ATPase n=1 Tax=Ruminococcus sp. TaxID=41978 RepID=UPI0025D1DADB|nr:AAA family ATPase [Ruminococcus sp.]
METKLLTLYSDVTAVPVKWLWHPYIAIGKITLLQGDPGCGKSSMMMNLIAELSNGGSTPDGRAFGPPQRIIYQCSEDGAKDTIKPRLIAAGADCRNIAFIDEEVYSGLTLDDERIREAITEWRPRLVVIDPIQSYIGNDSDLQLASKARKLMRRIGMWASTYNCAIVLIGHFTKNEGAKDLYRGLGSIDVVAAARSVLQVEKSEEDAEVRIVKQVKNSLDSNGADLSFEIRPHTGFKWLGVATEESDMEESQTVAAFEALPKNKHELAALLIKRALGKGAVESMEIRRIMAEYRIGEKTMNEVKAELGIKPYRKRKAWYWILPGSNN